MKNLKILILAFGVLGIVGLFLPMGEGMPSFFSVAMEFDKAQLIMMLVAFGLPAAVGALGLVKPPAQSWHGIAALLGFALGAVKTRVWEAAPHIMDAPLSMKLMLVGVIGGVVVSGLALAKPEAKA